MKKQLLLFFLLWLYCCCKTAEAQRTPREAHTEAAATPMACKIKGQVTRILKGSAESTGPYAHHPCRAKVKILDVYGCGQGVTTLLNKGDVIEVRFAFTLDRTRNIFPSMKTKYPGLKVKDVFVANAEQRLAMNDSNDYVVYDYLKK